MWDKFIPSYARLQATLFWLGSTRKMASGLLQSQQMISSINCPVEEIPYWCAINRLWRQSTLWCHSCCHLSDEPICYIALALRFWRSCIPSSSSSSACYPSSCGDTIQVACHHHWLVLPHPGGHVLTALVVQEWILLQMISLVSWQSHSIFWMIWIFLFYFFRNYKRLVCVVELLWCFQSKRLIWSCVAGKHIFSTQIGFASAEFFLPFYRW